MPLNPDELLDQANALAGKRAATQADLRRAISGAYYAVFHFCLAAAADMVLGTASRSTKRCTLIYRSIDHKSLRALCEQLRRTSPQNVPISPSSGFGKIVDFARVTSSLYEQRIRADYDPSIEYTIDETKVAVSDAREAIAWLRSSDDEQQKAFLTMLLFKQRFA